MHAFYMPNFSVDSAALSEEEGAHAHRTLRIKVGAPLLVLDGQGGRYFCRLKGDKAKGYPLSVDEIQHVSQRALLHLLVSPPKQPSRLEWIVEKSAELGLQRLTFLRTKRTERKTIALDRLNRISIAAMKQSQQPFKLKIEGMRSFSEALAIPSKARWMAHPTAQRLDLRSSTKGTSATVLIGPEGGFTPEELDTAVQSGYQPFSMSAYTLRTETAALVAAAWFLR